MKMMNISPLSKDVIEAAEKWIAKTSASSEVHQTLWLLLNKVEEFQEEFDRIEAVCTDHQRYETAQQLAWEITGDIVYGSDQEGVIWAGHKYITWWPPISYEEEEDDGD